MSEDGPAHRVRWLQRQAAKWGPSMATAAVSVGMASVGGIGPDLAPFVAAAFSTMTERVTHLGERTRQEVDNDDLLLASLEQEQLRDLFIQCSEAAARTSLASKRIAMARALGEAAKMPAATEEQVVEDQAVLITTLVALEAPHFRYLGQLEDSFDKLKGVLVPEPYNSTLQSHGLVSARIDGGSASGGGGIFATGLTPFGRRLLQYVRDAEAELDAGDVLGRPTSPPG